MSEKALLFRPQAVDASRNRTGAPVSNPGLATWIIVLFMTAVFACAVAFISIARYTKKETVLGQVVPAQGVARVAPMRGGVIKKIWVASGETVAPDQLLFALSYDAVLEDGGSLAGRINQSTNEQITLTQEELDSKERQLVLARQVTVAKLDELVDEKAGVLKQRDIQLERFTSLQKDYDAFKLLLAKGFTTQVQVTARMDAMLTAQQRLLDLEEAIHHHDLSVVQMRAELANNDHSLTQLKASGARARSQLEGQRLTSLAEQGAHILASKGGRLTSVQVKEGDLVAPNQTLALIVPEGGEQLSQVVLWVPSRAIGFVQPGHKVRLMFDAFPYQTFGVGTGRVAEISMAPILPSELPTPIDTQEQMYKVAVELDRDTLEAYGRSWPLKAGMRLTADLVIDEKSLLGWLLDPITALRKRAAG